MRLPHGFHDLDPIFAWKIDIADQHIGEPLAGGRDGLLVRAGDAHRQSVGFEQFAQCLCGQAVIFDQQHPQRRTLMFAATTLKFGWRRSHTMCNEQCAYRFEGRELLATVSLLLRLQHYSASRTTRKPTLLAKRAVGAYPWRSAAWARVP